MRLCFADCRVDTEARTVERAGEPVSLSPKAFQLLLLLLDQRPRALSQAELRDALWPDAHVGYTSLAQLVTELRKAIGDTDRPPQWVRTVSRFGYAFAEGVVEESSAGLAAAPPGGGAQAGPGDPNGPRRPAPVPAGQEAWRTGARRRFPILKILPGSLVVAALLVAAFQLGVSRHRPPAPPRFTQLTFGRGIVTSARFAADGHTVVYSALWDGGAPEVFSRRLDSGAASSLGLPPATLLSVSARGDLAVLLAPPGELGVVWVGTLARLPLSGGPLRPILEGVLDADWSPDGQDLAVIRWRDGAFQLEYPIGSVLLRPCPPTHLRISPLGDRVALLDARGLLVLDRQGGQQLLPLPPAHQRLAWSPDGRSLLVDVGLTDSRRTLQRVGMDRRGEVVCALAGPLVLHDVSRDGRVLIHHGLEHWGVRVRGPADPVERDASVAANAGVAGLSADGRQVLLWDGSQGEPGAMLQRPAAGGPAVRLGDGHAHGLSDDSKWVAVGTVRQGEPSLLLVPTSSGEVAPLDVRGLELPPVVWLVDQGRVGLNAAQPGRARRAFVTRASPRVLRAIAPEGTIAVPGLLPDSTILTLEESSGALALHTLEGARQRMLPWRLAREPFLEPIRVSGDGRWLYLRRGSVPARVDRVDLESGTASSSARLAPPDPTGTGHVWSIYLTPDGSSYAYTHGLFLQDLFLVEGLP